MEKKWKRDRKDESLWNILKWYVKNNIRDTRVLDVFKTARINVSNADVREYKI